MLSRRRGGTGSGSGHRRDWQRPGRREDRGSTIFLLPAGVLVVLVLGAIAVDLTVVHLASRQAIDAATAAADDAAGAALDVASVRAGTGIRIDGRRARSVARATVAARQLPHDVRSVEVSLGPGPDEVTVVVTLVVEPVIGAALGGGDHVVRGTGTATLIQR